MSRDETNVAVSVVGLALLVVLAGALWFGLGDSATPPLLHAPPPEALPLEVLPSDDRIRVHVSGAVSSPGVVELPAGSIVADAVRAAGGATQSANFAATNLAALLRTGELLVIPEIGIGSTAATSQHAEGIDLNSSSASELENLPGVGPVLAHRIVAHRVDHGPFKAVEDLLDVPGIGESKLASMRDSITRP